MPQLLEMSIRVLVAALLGAVIGYEREIRAKGAGVRTHVLVALGSALFMIVSQYGFDGADKFDAARVAAGVVGGLGFLGGGIIMKTKNHVTGLTTAAGIWVTGSIGLAVGCGLYALSCVCVVLALACLEALNFYSFKHGEKELSVVFSSPDKNALASVISDLGRKVKDYSLSKTSDGYKAEITLHVPKKEYNLDLLSSLSSLPNVELESME